MTDLETDSSSESSSEGSPESAPEDVIGAFLSTYERARTREAYGHDLREFFCHSAGGPPGQEGLGREKVSRDESSYKKENSYKNVSREQLSEVRAGEVEAFLEKTREEKGEAAARRRGAALRSFYRWARGKGIVEGRAAEKIREVARPVSGEDDR